MIRLSFALLASCSLAHAQGVSIFVPDNMATSGSSNVIPFGNSKTSTTWRNQKYQMLIPSSFANNRPTLIRDLGFAASKTNVHNFDEIKISVGLTTASTLSQTFANNVRTRPMTLLQAKDYTWRPKAGQWVRIGLQRSYTWVPTLGNLVIDIETRGTGGVGTSSGGFRTGNTIERKYNFGWTGTTPTTGQSSVSRAALKVELVVTNADASAFGTGCRGSNGFPTLSFQGLPQLGKQLTTTLTNGRQRTLAVSVFGFTAPTPPFPVDLTSAGAPGCKLYQSLDLLVPGPTDGNGALTQRFTIPNTTSLVGAIYFNQFFVLDQPINQLDLVSSNYGRVLIGQ